MSYQGNPTNERRIREAVDWFFGNQSREEFDEATLREWELWAAIPENRSEYAEVVLFQQQARMLPRPRQAGAAELQADLRRLNGGERNGPTSSGGRLWQFVRSTSRGSRLVAATICAIILALAVGATLFLRASWPPRSATGSEFAFKTSPGEQRSVSLSDGSLIFLGGDSDIVVRFTNSERLIVLRHGEGMFRVQHETDRPFRVCAASACTTAVGTTFDIRRYSTHVRVWVEEGAVKVAPTAAQSTGDQQAIDGTRWLPVQLIHGQEMSYDPQGGVSATRAIDSTAGAWTNGILVYRRRPLAEAIEDVQRYSRRRVVLDPAAKGLLYSGSVVEQHLDEWIRSLPYVFPVDVVDCGRVSGSTDVPHAAAYTSCTAAPDSILIRYRVSP